MEKYPFDRDINSESDVLDFYSDAIYYRENHKDESTRIATYVFDRTHPKGRLSFPVSANIESLRNEFGALEAPGMPESDDENPSDHDDGLWRRLLVLVETEKRTANTREETTSDFIILTQISELITFAESLPLEMITKKNPEPIYPVTIGEYLVSFMLDKVLQRTWGMDHQEALAEPLIELLTQLDTGVDRPNLWGELFTENSTLKKYLEKQ